MTVAGGGSAGGGAAAVIVDILANAGQLGTTLQQAEKQVEASAQKMGKAMDTAMQGARPAASRAIGTRGMAILQAVTPMVQSMAADMKAGFEQRFDLGDSLSKGLTEAVRSIPHPAAQIGVAIADAITPYGERAGISFARAFMDTTGTTFAAEFHAGTYYGLGDFFSDFFSNRTVRMPFTGVRVGANENLIADRRRELAELQTQQQLLSIEDRRGAMIQQRMQFGVSQVQTGYGTISVALGRPDEASRRVYDAAMRQVMALERIQAIVEEIGGNAGMAMRN